MRTIPDKTWRAIFFTLGWLMLGLGVVGAFLPVMPTTVFLILAAACFGRSSPRLESWMLSHPRFGSALRDWREYGAISRKAKAMSFSGMALGYGVFWFGTDPGPWLAVAVAVLMIIGAAYVATRPDRGRDA